MRRLPAEDVLCTFDHHALKAHVCHHSANLVVVDERTVAEDFRVQSEELLDFLCLTFCLSNEVIDIAQRRKAVAVGFCEELYTAGGCQPPEEVEHLWSVLLDEFQRNAADAKGYLEGFAVFLNHVEHCLQGRLVALFEELVNDALVFVVVVVVVVCADVEETVALEMYRLVYLEV